MSEGHDPLSMETLRSGAQGPAAARGLPCLTIAAHPDPARIGERLRLTGLLAGKPQSVSRREGRFGRPGASGGPLADPYVSRRPLVVRPGGRADTLGVELPEGSDVHIDGLSPDRPLVEIDAERLRRGVSIRLGNRTLLWLHTRVEPPDAEVPGLLGDSDGIRALRHAVVAAAQHDEPVLVRGASGTGKELVARALHGLGPRRDGPMIAFNMAGLAESIAGSSLFGHVRGAFTGADRTHRGLFEQASSGVLFLDEIGDTPATVQPMLLRALETGTITAVGAERERRVDVRVVAATDLDLEAAVADGRFRAPLYHRLAGQTLTVPALAARRDDIGPLLRHFMAELLAAEGRPELLAAAEPGQPSALPAPWVEAVLLDPLPGNVRELRSLAREAARQLLAGAAPTVPRRSVPAVPAVPAVSEGATLVPPPPAEAAATAGPADAARILAALQAHDFVPDRAARALGIASSTIHYFMRHSDSVRRATDIPDAELREALDACEGDLVRAARQLRVSRRALGMTLRQRGIAP